MKAAILALLSCLAAAGLVGGIVVVSISGSPHGGTLSYALQTPGAVATYAPGPPTDPPTTITYRVSTPAPTPAPTARPTTAPTATPAPTLFTAAPLPDQSWTDPSFVSLTGDALHSPYLCNGWATDLLARDAQLDAQSGQQYPQYADYYATWAGHWQMVSTDIEAVCHENVPLSGTACNTVHGWFLAAIATHQQDLAAATPMNPADWDTGWIKNYNDLLALWGPACGH